MRARRALLATRQGGSPQAVAKRETRAAHPSAEVQASRGKERDRGAEGAREKQSSRHGGAPLTHPPSQLQLSSKNYPDQNPSLQRCQPHTTPIAQRCYPERPFSPNVFTCAAGECRRGSISIRQTAAPAAPAAAVPLHRFFLHPSGALQYAPAQAHASFRGRARIMRW